MTDSLLNRIAAESDDIRAERAALTQKLIDLKAGRRILEGQARRGGKGMFDFSSFCIGKEDEEQEEEKGKNYGEESGGQFQYEFEVVLMRNATVSKYTTTTIPSRRTSPLQQEQTLPPTPRPSTPSPEAQLDNPGTSARTSLFSFPLHLSIY